MNAIDEFRMYPPGHKYNPRPSHKCPSKPSKRAIQLFLPCVDMLTCPVCKRDYSHSQWSTIHEREGREYVQCPAGHLAWLDELDRPIGRPMSPPRPRRKRTE